MGDSIMYWVVPSGPSTALTANLIPGMTNGTVSIANLSRPGARASELLVLDQFSSDRAETVTGSACGSLAQCPYSTLVSTYLYRNLFNYFSNWTTFWAPGPTGVIITLGRNDWDPTGQNQESTNQLYQDYSALVAAAVANNLKVVCIGPIWDGEEATASSTAENNMLNVRVVIQWACNNNGGKFVDGYNAVPHNVSVYYGDSTGTHLNAAGHQVFSQWLVAQMHTLGYW